MAAPEAQFTVCPPIIKDTQDTPPGISYRPAGIENAQRVAIVSESSLEHMSGVTTSVKCILRELESRGRQAILICPAPAPATYAGAEVVTTPYVRVKGFNVGLLYWQRRMEKVFERFEPDVVHAASPAGFIGKSAIKAANHLDIPSVAVFQTNLERYAPSMHFGALVPYMKRRLKHLHNGADINLVTKSMHDEFIGLGVQKNSVRIWARGVDSELFTPERRKSPAVTALREQWAPDGEPIIGFVGRLAPEKSVEQLAALLDLPAKLVIVGQGPNRQSIEAAMKGRAILTGEKRGRELANHYAAFDIFVSASTTETFGQTTQEAEATELPVVEFAAGGNLETVEHGKTGFLAPPDDMEAFKAYVYRLIRDRELRETTGRQGRQSILDRPWSAICDQLFGEHYREAMARRRPKRQRTGPLAVVANRT